LKTFERISVIQSMFFQFFEVFTVFSISLQLRQLVLGINLSRILLQRGGREPGASMFCLVVSPLII
jgi:hypothetical protein